MLLVWFFVCLFSPPSAVLTSKAKQENDQQAVARESGFPAPLDRISFEVMTSGPFPGKWAVQNRSTPESDEGPRRRVVLGWRVASSEAEGSGRPQRGGPMGRPLGIEESSRTQGPWSLGSEGRETSQVGALESPGPGNWGMGGRGEGGTESRGVRAGGWGCRTVGALGEQGLGPQYRGLEDQEPGNLRTGKSRN